MAKTTKNTNATQVAPARTPRTDEKRARDIIMLSEHYQTSFKKAREEFLAKAAEAPADAIAWNGEAATIAFCL